ncbi:sigma-70 family RNA polymerase sigma factor [Pseudoramibacter faecis]|uniref:RNA polymerase sigma factor n=1 Tax=Pseudoramibacter faecis TaxID=3108534 RepID=UPI002E7A9F4F|nr:sigma-70 family RNA polymerase sigma factor [Pseudoramibacter sp. HA2172]
MKITVYYEDKNHPTILEVPDDECSVWVETDYQMRLAKAEDKSAVKRRTAQEIMDEDYNKPTFNNNQTETRRHTSLDALDPDGQHIPDGTDFLKDPDKREQMEGLHAAIQKLQPQQRKLLHQIFVENKKQKDIAAEEGVSPQAITRRLNKIYAALKNILK